MHKHKFISANIDEQLKPLSQTPQHHPSTEGRLIKDLYHTYAEDMQSRDRVWDRLNQVVQQEKSASETGSPQTGQKILSYEKYRNTQDENHPARRTKIQYIALIASLMIAISLVGSAFWIFNLARPHHNPPAAPHIKQSQQKIQSQHTLPAITSPQGIYVGGSDGVYRADVKTGNVLWHIKLQVDPKAPVYDNTPFANSMTLTANILYVTSQDGSVYALDANTGSIRWSAYLQGIPSKPVVMNGSLFVGSSSSSDSSKGIVFVLDATTGIIKSQYQFNSADSGIADIAVDNQTLYVTSFYDMYAINISTGNQLWHQQIVQHQILGTPQIIKGVLYTTSSEESHHVAVELEPQDSYIYAFDAKTGANIWTTQKMNGYVFSAAISNGVIYCGALNHVVYAYDQFTGHLLWQHDVGGEVSGTLQVEDQMVFVKVDLTGQPGTQNSNIDTTAGTVALDAKTGLEKWRVHDFSASFSKNLIAQHGIVYTESKQSFIDALNTLDGTLLWSKEISLRPMSIFVVS